MKRQFLAALLIGLTILATPVDAKEVKVKSYTKKDGTKVSAHTRTIKDPGTVKVKGYTKKDGTRVKSYVRRMKNE